MFWGAVVQPNGRSLYGRLKIALQCVKMSGSVFNRTPWNSIFAARQKRQNRNSTYFWTTYLADLFSCTLGFLLVRFLFYVSVFGDGLRSKGCWWKEMTQNMSILLWSKITGRHLYQWLGCVVWKNNHSKSESAAVTLNPHTPLISEHSQWNITRIFEHILLQQCTGVVPNYFSILPLAAKEH